MAKYQRYAEYKDSGVEWLGEIPSHWKIQSLKHQLIFMKNGSTATQIDETEETVPISRIETISSGEIDMSRVGYIHNKSIPQGFELDKGDILFSHINSLSMIGNVAIKRNNDKLFHGMNLLRLKLDSNKAVIEYVFWLLKSKNLRQVIEANAKPAINQASISTQSLRNIYLNIPTEKEQTQIANFLDHETAKIDTLIDKQQTLIKLLKEKRQAVISHAVTKGLNPDAPMKDSGVEWLGDVPAHWEVKRFKNIFKIRKRIAGKTGYKVLSITQRGIKVKDIESNEGQLSMDYSKYQLVFKGDFAMNHMDLLTGFVDVSKFDGVTSPDYRVFTLEEKNSVHEYFLAFLQMGYINRLFFPFGQGAAHFGRWRLPTEAFNEFLAPVPPKDEQKAIADFIFKKLEQMDALEEKCKKAIQLMQERRTALISAAVTGKIDVRDWRAVE